MNKDIIIHGDCLIEMQRIPDKSVDLVLCDLPYGVLNKGNIHAKWDSVIPFEPLWEQYRRIIKDNGAIVLFAQGMFTANLMVSNQDVWKYNLIYKKGNSVTGFLNARRMPLRNHEDICVFYKKLPTYNPQMCESDERHYRNNPSKKISCYGHIGERIRTSSNEYFPKSIIDIPKEPQLYHPTQKPVLLLEYLIKTYTDEGDTVLDNTCGSGSTLVACVNANRHYIGIEKEKEYYDISVKRVSEAKSKLSVC